MDCGYFYVPYISLDGNEVTLDGADMPKLGISSRGVDGDVERLTKIVEDLRNQLETQKLEYEAMMEEGFQEAYNCIAELRSQMETQRDLYVKEYEEELSKTLKINTEMIKNHTKQLGQNTIQTNE